MSRAIARSNPGGSGQSGRALHIHYDPQGREAYIDVAATPLRDAAGRVTGVIEVCRDVTEQKRRQLALRKRQLQIAHASWLSSLGELATGMAHKIDRPLTIISTAAEGILRNIRKERLP